MLYMYSIIIYGNEQKWVKLLSVTLIFAICWLLNIYGGYLGVHPHWKPIVDARMYQRFALSIHHNYTAAHIKYFHSGQLVAFSA